MNMMECLNRVREYGGERDAASQVCVTRAPLRTARHCGDARSTLQQSRAVSKAAILITLSSDVNVINVSGSAFNLRNLISAVNNKLLSV
jgi:hypothetical protein